LKSPEIGEVGIDAEDVRDPVRVHRRRVSEPSSEGVSLFAKNPWTSAFSEYESWKSAATTRLAPLPEGSPSVAGSFWRSIAPTALRENTSCFTRNAEKDVCGTISSSSAVSSVTI
jgi:hypothetical protein